MRIEVDRVIWGIPLAWTENDATGSGEAHGVAVYCHPAEGAGERSCDAAMPRVRLRKTGEAPLTHMGEGVGFVFGDEWSTPIEIEGEGLPTVAFRNGRIRLIGGQVRFSEGLEATIYSHPSSKVQYSFIEDRWQLRGFAAVIGALPDPRARPSRPIS
ncbi:MAG: hypothetical protein ACE5HV_18430 [Acidobacteriota bacterium]